MKTLYFVAFLILLNSCNNSPAESTPKEIAVSSPTIESSPIVESQSDFEDTDDDNVQNEYPDDRYCAAIRYYNPNTGTSSSYSQMDVEVENGELTIIYFSNGGWLDESHFVAPQIEAGGIATVITDKGYIYKIEIQSQGGCFSQNDSEEEDEDEDLSDEEDEEEDGDEDDGGKQQPKSNLTHRQTS